MFLFFCPWFKMLLSCHHVFIQNGMIMSPAKLGQLCTLDDMQPSYRDNWNCTAVKSGPKSFRSILTYDFLYKYIVWSHIFISLLFSMFSSTLLIACTISVIPVRWLSSSVHRSHKMHLYTVKITWQYVRPAVLITGWQHTTVYLPPSPTQYIMGLIIMF